MTITDDLHRAIEEHHVALLRYERDDEPDRTVHPHGMFWTSQATVCVETYQVDGYTTSGDLPQWRHFTLDKIESVTVLDDEFMTAPGWNPHAAKYRHGFLVCV